MKKLSKVILLVLLILCFSINYCFADVYAGPSISISTSLSLIGILFLLFIGLMIIIVLCILGVAKLIKAEKLVDVSKKDLESFIYLLLLFLSVTQLYFFVNAMLILPFVEAAISMFFRWKEKNKLVSYAIIGSIMVINLVLCELAFVLG